MTAPSTRPVARPVTLARAASATVTLAVAVTCGVLPCGSGIVMDHDGDGRRTFRGVGVAADDREDTVRIREGHRGAGAGRAVAPVNGGRVVAQRLGAGIGERRHGYILQRASLGGTERRA